MASGVFIHRVDSIYDDSPAERYPFPAQYLGRATPCIGDRILYYELRKVATRGYFAVAKVERSIADPSAPGMDLARSSNPAPISTLRRRCRFAGPDGPAERGVLNDQGKISGR